MRRSHKSIQQCKRSYQHHNNAAADARKNSEKKLEVNVLITAATKANLHVGADTPNARLQQPVLSTTAAERNEHYRRGETALKLLLSLTELTGKPKHHRRVYRQSRHYSEVGIKSQGERR